MTYNDPLGGFGRAQAAHDAAEPPEPQLCEPGTHDIRVEDTDHRVEGDKLDITFECDACGGRLYHSVLGISDIFAGDWEL